MIAVVCTKNTTHRQFITKVRTTSVWVVNERGQRLKEMMELEREIVPGPSNAWTCAECGAPAICTQEKEVEGTLP
jgi:hypothetical protein